MPHSGWLCVANLPIRGDVVKGFDELNIDAQRKAASTFES